MEEDYQKLRAGWAAGDRDRERALHLLYLSWWHWAEPDFLTGLSDDPTALQLWRAIFEHFGGRASVDAEFLFVAAIMIEITTWAFGDEDAWAKVADMMIARSLLLKPDGFSAASFEDRGCFGVYFAHQASTLRV
ncbi:hypothetical protein ASE90_08665 [Sphingomonas sp. Leaf67]|uniref:hypothetical protein n=1 Tax=Sphingomonas sp. Leaf67 TaxID=1736230 RepID=UPI0006F4BB94|nr:hypothetical protein [Sphingomonas sp. Leaf67]KQN82840.1 hypothetical protein ASE90_08665 [Sphingomonas sp. Leaf67]